MQYQEVNNEKLPPNTTQPTPKVERLSKVFNVSNSLSQSLSLNFQLTKTRGKKAQIQPPLVEFHDAPPFVVALLKKNLSNISTSKELVEKKRKPTEELVECLKNHPEGGAKAVKHLIKLCNLFHETSHNFRMELKTLREKTFPYEKKGGIGNEEVEGGYILPHWARYPKNAPIVFQLVRAIALLQEIEATLKFGNGEIIEKWKNSITSYLKRAEISPILEKKQLIENIFDKASPYLCVQGKANEFEKNYWNRYKVGDLYSDQFMCSREREWKKNAKNLLKQNPPLARSIRKEFLSLTTHFSEIHLFKEDYKPKRIGSTESHFNIDLFPSLLAFCPTLNGSIISQLGYQSRLAKMLIDGGGIFPEIVKDGQGLKLTQVISPTLLIEKNQEETWMKFLGLAPRRSFGRAEPVDIDLKEGKSLLVITGPNAAGKTVAVQTLSACAVINQAGLPILANQGSMPIYSAIKAVFPRQLQLREGQGFLGACLEEIDKALSNAKKTDLLVLDEVPAGTDYQDLVSISVVLFRKIIKEGITCAVTGHIKEIFHRLIENPSIQLTMTSLTVSDGQIIADYKLKAGIAEHSYGITLLEELEFPSEIVASSKRYYAELTGTEYPRLDAQFGRARSGDQIAKSHLEIAAVKTFQIYRENFSFRGVAALPIRYVAGFAEKQMGLRDIFEDPETLLKDDQGISFIDNQKRALKLLSDVKQVMEVGAESTKLIKDNLDKISKLMEQELRKLSFSFNKEYIPQSQTINQWINYIVSLASSLKYPGQFFTDHIELLTKYVELMNNWEKVTLGDSTVESEVVGLLEKISGSEKHQSLGLRWRACLAYVANTLARIDFVTGVALRNLELKFRAPTFTDEPGILEISDARPFNPSITRSIFLRESVPFNFSKEGEIVSVITGPNGTGKTVCEYTIYNLVSMALAGFYVPAKIKLSWFNKVYSYFGAENQTTAGTSYFKGVLEKYLDIVKKANPGSLVILDEIHGSDFLEMNAIQSAMIDYLHSKQIYSIYNTHMRDGLKKLAENRGIKLYRTTYDFDPIKNRVTPYFQIVADPHLITESHGLAVAAQFFSSEEIAEMRNIKSE